MKITLYPTADGCHRPLAVESLARAWLDAGSTVAIASTHGSLVYLKGKGAVCVQGEDGWKKLPGKRPTHAVFDALDLSDPDGQEIICRQGRDRNLFSVPAVRFRAILDELARHECREVLLVLMNTEISQPWQEQLKEWDVEIRWSTADSAPWRNWKISSPDTGDLPHDVLRDAGVHAMAAFVLTPRAQMLMTLAAEYTDINLAGHEYRPPDVPVNIILRLLAGKPIEDRLLLTGQLLDDLRTIVRGVEDLHSALGGGTASTSGSRPAGRPAGQAGPPLFWKKTLH